MPNNDVTDRPCGDVVPRVAELIQLAQYTWKIRHVPVKRIAEDTKASVSTLDRLIDGTAKRFSLNTIGRICWYFGCQPSDVLTYWPANAGQLPHLLPDVLSRTQPRSRSLSDATSITVVNQLPVLLREHVIVNVAGQTGLDRDTVSLAQRGADQIRRSTLAALCWYLNRSIDDLFTVTYPLD